MPPAPSAKKMMEEKGLADGDVDGSGKRGQVLKGDVLEAIARGAPSRAAGKAGAEGGARARPARATRRARSG